MRFHLIDRIDELRLGHYAVGAKAVTLSEDVFEHHFPGQPIYPGSLLVESLAQLGGALLELTLREQLPYTPRCVLSSIKAKFREPVRPGDLLCLRCEVLALRPEAAQVKAEAHAHAQRVAEAELVFVTVKLEDERLQAARESFLEIVTRGARIVT